jgi:hypothetical protein
MKLSVSENDITGLSLRLESGPALAGPGGVCRRYVETACGFDAMARLGCHAGIADESRADHGFQIQPLATDRAQR